MPLLGMVAAGPGERGPSCLVALWDPSLPASPSLRAVSVAVTVTLLPSWVCPGCRDAWMPKAGSVLYNPMLITRLCCSQGHPGNDLPAEEE